MPCDFRDSTAYPGRSNQPPLYRLHLAGWLIGDKSDRCPNCASTVAAVDFDVYFTPARMAELCDAAASTVRTRLQTSLLAGLTEDEIDTLRSPA